MPKNLGGTFQKRYCWFFHDLKCHVSYLQRISKGSLCFSSSKFSQRIHETI